MLDPTSRLYCGLLLTCSPDQFNIRYKIKYPIIMSTLSQSKVFDWNEIPTEPTKAGATKKFFKDVTGTLDQMSVHVTMLPPGASAHAPHEHPEEEMILLKEGSLEALHNGERKSMSPGSILFIAPNDLHGVTNNGNTQAVYYVIKWFSPGMLKSRNQ